MHELSLHGPVMGFIESEDGYLKLGYANIGIYHHVH